MNILMFGNSHSACVIEAWKKAKTAGFSAADITFFVRAGSGMAEFDFGDRTISAANPEFKAFLTKIQQPSTCDLDSYDAIICVGAEVSAFKIIQIISRNYILEWGGDNPRNLPAITLACLRDALRDSIYQTNAYKLFAELHKRDLLNGKQILCLPQPNPSDKILTDQGHGYPFRKAIETEAGALGMKEFNEACTSIFAELGVVFIPQEQTSIVSHVLTGDSFMREGPRLVDMTKRQPEKDFLHANAVFGHIVLTQAFSAFGMPFDQA